MDNSIRAIGRIVAWFLLSVGITLFFISLLLVVIKNHLETGGVYTGITEVVVNRFTILGLPCIGMVCIGYALLSRVLGWRIVILFLGLLIALLYTWIFGGVYIQQAMMK